MNTIVIDNKKYPCRVTMGAMLRFKEETGHDVQQINQDDISDLIILQWCCVVSASKADGVKFDMSLMDFADRLDIDVLTEFFINMGQETSAPEKKTTRKPKS